MTESLGDRMKGYEVAFRTTLPGRMPVILRIDGKAFHTYTVGTDRPFDKKLGDVMIDVTKKLCESIQGAQLGYTQSDEISILIHGYKKFDSQPWFDNQVQKMVSIAAGTASAWFTAHSWRIWSTEDDHDLSSLKPAIFDARAFVLPESEVNNYFLWRQQDATRNSIQMLARSLYSHKQCDNKGGHELQEMCFQKGHNWNDLPVRWRRGVCVRRARHVIPGEDQGPYAARMRWQPDFEIPLFNEKREYVNDLLQLEQE